MSAKKPDTKRRTGGIPILVIWLLGVTLAAGLVTVILWWMGHQVWAAVVGTFMIFSAELVIMVVCFGFGCWVSANLMQAGGDLVLKAQDINDGWDARKTQAFANFANTLTRTVLSGRSSDGSAQLLPSQRGDLLPELTDWTEGEVVGVMED